MRALRCVALIASLLFAAPAVAQQEFRLCGLFSYENAGNGVASFGTVAFDGAGAANLKIKINALSSQGGRTTREVEATGPYTLDGRYAGTMVFALPDIGIAEARYDFVAVDVAEATPVELFAVLRGGGVNGQMVTPRLRRIQPCGPEFNR